MRKDSPILALTLMLALAISLMLAGASAESLATHLPSPDDGLVVEDVLVEPGEPEAAYLYG